MKLKYLIYTITLTGLTACGDFLEPKSQSQYIPKDANALQEMLIGEAYPQQKEYRISQPIWKYSQMMSSRIRWKVTNSLKTTKKIWKYLRYCIAGNPICSKYEKNWDNNESIHGRTFMNIF